MTRRACKCCGLVAYCYRNLQTEEDKQRQIGPGLVVLSRGLPETISPDDFYVQGDDKGCRIVEGSQLPDPVPEGVCGRVLFICKPPARTAEARLDSYALLSL